MRAFHPDIEVIDRPELVAAGKDPCIEKAVQVLLEQLKEKPAQKNGRAGRARPLQVD